MFELIAEEKIRLENIVALPDAQPRLKLNSKTVNDYVQDLIIDGWETFEPIIVFTCNKTIFFLADGFHRLAAHQQIRTKWINAKIFRGGERDAILYSCGANKTHGLRRSNEDRENAILKLLRDPEWSQWNNVKLAEIAKCCSTTVANIAQKHGIDRPEKRLTESNGEIKTIILNNPGRKVNIPNQITRTVEQFVTRLEKVEDKNSYLEKYFDLLSEKLGIKINFDKDF